MSKRPRTFKLRALHSQDKYGVAGKNCQEVLLKGCQKFQLPISGCRLCLYEDGTELTEGYFQRLPDNTELMLLTPGQAWQGYISDIHRFLTIFYQPQADIIQAAQKLLSDERAPLRQKLLADFLHNISENIQAETREEDGPWFEGLESRFRNKSSYLRYSCESRIRSYLKEVNAHASTLDPQPRAEYLKIIGQMCEKLKSERYNGSYFDRRDKVRERLCTAEGWFSCQGPFDLDACLSKHSINPYSNRESRILFSTWNLDHKIEKKRTIVPTLTEAVAEQDGREVDWEYFYSLLFTSNNLKLVHIACHKKSSHNLSCDETRIYKPKKQVVRKRAARRRQ
ncbi:DNA fragmentation factor subunit beta-like isoform X1 [Vombatus ursinus]|uniref:DNA fragmentation factor subunit beta n=1 Tax=Vombatus ursinus TaxID=29139 RepID=A0A4X2MBF5_VOMUR|nr:DNA fragmentation factor subunit beta isoform X1 [Vombatus ursinus]XP_027699706.1 DNA fragmentation factor subunit beta-like isoform X1 [Vombatus ursinus]